MPNNFSKLVASTIGVPMCWARLKAKNGLETMEPPDYYKKDWFSAKILAKYAKGDSHLKIVAGFMDGKVLEAKDVAEIATLPTLDEARAKIAAILSGPAQKILSILLAPGSKIAILAHAKSKKS